MCALQKESPRHAPTWGGGKNQFQAATLLPQDGKAVNVKVCRTCGYFREVPAKVRTRRFCAWPGEKLAADAVAFDCAGYHAGEWGQLWEV